MNIKKHIAACVLGTLLVLPTGITGALGDVLPENSHVANTVQNNEKTQVSAYDSLTHQQQVWVNALEWCESRGKKEAINPNDVDNTPSYYSFQFKPSTFKQYGEKYGVIEKNLEEEELKNLLKDHFLQREIVSHMLGDKTINFRNQFPACVKSLGLPTRTFTTDTKDISKAEVATTSKKIL